MRHVLAIGGSDGSGGAGIQADIKTITGLGAYASTAITAITAQDTRAVHRILAVPADLLETQIRCVLADLGADAIKVGMLGTAVAVEVVARACADHPRIPVVLDPVLAATAGEAPLLSPDALAPLRAFFPRVTLLTPNAAEAAALTGCPVTDAASQHRVAAALRAMGAAAVLVKGGHLPGETVTDLLLTGEGEAIRLTSPRQATRHTHGTGCTLASAIATGVAQGLALLPAVRRARAYVQAAIATAPGLGHGAGPLNHAVALPPGASWDTDAP